MRESDITETCPLSIASKHDTRCMGTDFQRNRSRDDRHSWSDDCTAISIRAVTTLVLHWQQRKPPKSVLNVQSYSFPDFLVSVRRRCGRAELASSGIAQNNFWYATISRKKNDDLTENSRRFTFAGTHREAQTGSRIKTQSQASR